MNPVNIGERYSLQHHFGTDSEGSVQERDEEDIGGDHTEASQCCGV